MIVQNIKIKLLNARRIQGINKKGEPFMFYMLSFLDEEANVLKINMSNTLSADSGLTKKLDNLKETPVTIDLALRQSGFNLRGTVVAIDTKG